MIVEAGQVAFPSIFRLMTRSRINYIFNVNDHISQLGHSKGKSDGDDPMGSPSEIFNVGKSGDVFQRLGA